MDERDGKFTGELTRSPPTGEARALLLDEFARAQGLTLGETVAYADSTSDLPMLEAAGFPVAVNPEAKLAAIARRRGWAIEHWARAAGGPRRTLADRDRRPGAQSTASGWLTSFHGRRAVMRALLFERNLPRFAAARVASAVAGSGKGVRVGPLELVEVDALDVPGPDWVRVRPRLAGICGSDLATLGRPRAPAISSSSSASPSFPATRSSVTSKAGRLDGRRVVVEPVLGCEARGIEPRCPGCASGRKGSCERIAFGHLRPGLQTGYCPIRAAGGRQGWWRTRASFTRCPRTSPTRLR